MALWALQRVGAIKHLENSSPAHHNHSQLSLSLSLSQQGRSTKRWKTQASKESQQKKKKINIPATVQTMVITYPLLFSI